MPKVKVRVAGTPIPEEKKVPREILFRGKNIDGEWVYGSPVRFRDISRAVYASIIPYEQGQHWISQNTLVDPETVGQYTGLTVENGQKLFEGDIVRIKGNPDYPDYACVDYIALIAFIDGGFCAIDGTIEEHAFRRYNLARMDFDIEVIGNIHDNPELLEEEDD